MEYRGYEVTIIANVTDIDDKILIKSAEEGVPWWAHAFTFERALNEAYDILGCTPPTYVPRATGHIPEMLELIQTPDRPRACVCRARWQRRRLLRREVVALVRLAVGPAPRRHAGRRGRRPARQARPPRLRTLEGAQARRAGDGVAGRRRGDVAGRAGTSSARRWRASTSAMPSTSTAAASICASRTTRTSSRSRRRPASSSPSSGCTTPGSPRRARR